VIELYSTQSQPDLESDPTAPLPQQPSLTTGLK